MHDELDWDQLLEEFLDYVEDTTGARDPANVIATLRNVVGRWISFALDQGAHPEARNDPLLNEWVTSVLTIGTGPQRDYRARVRRWWRWSEDRMVIRGADIGWQGQVDDVAWWTERLDEYLSYLGDADLKQSTLNKRRGKLLKWIELCCSTGRDRDPGNWDPQALEKYFDKYDTTETPRQRDTIRRYIEEWCQYWSNGPAPEAVRCWVVRAGREGEAVEHNLANDVVTIG